MAVFKRSKLSRRQFMKLSATARRRVFIVAFTFLQFNSNPVSSVVWIFDVTTIGLGSHSCGHRKVCSLPV